MQEHDKAMIAVRGDEWMFSGARLRLQQAENMATYEAMILAAEKSRQGAAMDKERIKQMAVEAGGATVCPNYPQASIGDMAFGDSALERFAQAVARECLQAVADSSSPDTKDLAYAKELAEEAIRARFGIEGE